MTKRRVMTYKIVSVKAPPEELYGRKYVQVEDGEGIFVQYGTDFDEVRDVSCSVTSAIVEMPDGRVRNLPLNLIRFLKEEKEEK